MLPRRAPRHFSEEQRFWMRVEKTANCWLWLGRVSSDGYGAFSSQCLTRRRAHRYSWILHNGEVSNGLCVLHRCDNRICVRPDHLFLGTNRDNVADMIAKGRKPLPSNKKELPIVEIAQRYLRGESELSLSKAFGVNRLSITRRLIEVGIARRNQSAAMLVRMSKMTPAQRKAQAVAAQDALRGSTYRRYGFRKPRIRWAPTEE